VTCPFEKDRLSGYVDGELGAEERAGVERHVAACAECGRELDDLKATIGRLRAMPRAAAPASMAAAVAGGIGARPCGLAKERLSAYFDGEAAAGDLAEVEAHIAGCSDCLRELGDVKAAVSQVRGLPRVAAPASVAPAVARGIAGPGRAVRGWFQVTVAAAAVGLFAVCLVIIARQSAPAPSSVAMQPPPRPTAAPEGLARAPEARRQDEVAKKLMKEELQERGGLRDREEQKRDHELDALKDKAEQAGGRALEDATPAPAPQKAPAAREPAPAEEKAKGAPPPEAPKPAQPPAPAADPAASEQLRKAGKAAAKELEGARAENEEADDRLAQLEQSLKSAEGRGRFGGRSQSEPPPVLTVASAKLGDTREEVEELLKMLHIKITLGAAELGNTSQVKDSYVTVELSDAELEAVLKHLDRHKATLTAGTVAAEKAALAKARSKGYLSGEKKDEAQADGGKDAPADKKKESDPPKAGDSAPSGAGAAGGGAAPAPAPAPGAMAPAAERRVVKRKLILHFVELQK